MAAGFFYFERVTHQRLTDWQAEGGGLLRLPWALRGLSALSSGGPGGGDMRIERDALATTQVNVIYMNCCLC